MTTNLIIIGGGPAGVEAAVTAAPYTDRVTLVSDQPVGSWHQLAPSRVWLAAIEAMRAVARPPILSKPKAPNVELFNLSMITQHTRQIAAAWNKQMAKRLQDLRVNVIIGQASFAGSNSILIDQTDQLEADAIIVASGSSPFFPPSLAPDGQRIFSWHNVDLMPKLPKSLLVIGDGPIGIEFVHIFSQLGVAVQWFVFPGGPNCFIAPEADPFLVDMLTKRGVAILPGSPISALYRLGDRVVAVRASDTAPDERYEAEMAFVTVGSKPNLEALNLAAAGLSLDQGQLSTDEYGRTAIPSIYATGDARLRRAGNASMIMARVAALHAVGQPVTPPDFNSLAITFMSHPQVAKVGQLAAEDGSIQTLEIPYSACLKAHITANAEGFFKLAWDAQDRVVGGVAVGDHAADALTPVAIAIKMKATVTDLAALYAPHPTVSELPFIAARAREEVTSI